VLSPRGIPILFPFPNRIPQGRFAWNGREHRLDVNERERPNHIHGLVRDRRWTVEELDASADAALVRMTLDLAADDDAMRQYPFPCRISVTVSLRDGALGHDVVVANTGTEPMPMGYGIHPWFPPSLVGDRGATEVRVPAARRWELVDRIATGRRLPADGAFDLRRWRAVGTQEYDDVFTDITHRSDGWSDAAVRCPDAGVEVVVEESREFREWVFFSDPTRDAIAVEPYTCVTNAVNLQPTGADAGLIVLGPGARWQAFVRLLARVLG
jgi:aldose 1-epimerase